MIYTYSEGTGSVNAGRGDVGINLLVIWEVLVHDVEGLLVDFEVVMLLEVMDGVHATGLLNEYRILVDSTRTGSLLVHLANLENIVQAVERDLDNLVIHHVEQVTEGFDTSLGHKVTDLRWLLKSTRRRVGNSPAGLLAGLEVGVLENVDERRDDIGINDGLDLRRGASCNVGDGPARLLPDTLLSRRQERQESG